jgi:hypothetical protein
MAATRNPRSDAATAAMLPIYQPFVKIRLGETKIAVVPANAGPITTASGDAKNVNRRV